MHLPLHRILFLSFVALNLSGYLGAQPSGSEDPEKEALSAYIRMKYGLDQELFNGYQYFKRYIKYKGDPFYPKDVFYEGSVTIGGKGYDQLHLKYNCFSQFLVLEYTDYQGRYNQLRLNNALIDSFRLGNDRYQKISLSGKEPLFCQVLESSHASAYIHWKKMINATSDDLQYSHEYSRPLGTYYIQYQGEMYPFTNRKTFLSVFPESMVPEIKKYLRNQAWSFKDAGPGEIQNLLNYVSHLEESLSED